MNTSNLALSVLAAALLALPTGCNSPADSGAAKPAAAPTTDQAAKPAAATTDKQAAPAKPTKPTTTAKPTTSTTSTTSAPPATATPPEYAGAHVLIAYKGAQRAKPTITRTKAEALARAKKIAEQATAGADFAKLAADNSDGPSAKRGGSLGTWTKGRMVPEFDAAIEKLAIGGVSEPVETGFGYHVIKRLKPAEKRAGAHILVAYSGAMRAKPTITRTKDEARARATELVTKARANPDGFAELAQANSDGPSASRGGSLGTWSKGKMVPEFDNAIDTMKVGDISDPVETAFGFHVIKRLPLK